MTNERRKGKIGTGEGGVMNKNGERFMEFCAMNDVALFKHNDIHNFTSESRNHGERSQTDHIAISGTYKRSLLDTKAIRGADVGGDYHLVMAK